jgi:hypothetical protein
MGAGFPLFLVGMLILLTREISTGLVIASAAMITVGLLLFFDPR